MLMGAGGSGGHFEVSIPALHDGSRWLHGDSGDLSSAQRRADRALLSAEAAAGGGLLAGTLADLVEAHGEHAAALVGAVDAASARLARNAATYRDADADAAKPLSGHFDGVGGSK